MSQPTGKIVARPMVTRACGHQQEFQHYEVDRFRAQRLAKFQSTRCPECVAKLNAEQQKNAPVPKPEAIRMLPPGTQVSLARRPDGSWEGVLNADGRKVEASGDSGSGPQAVIGTLAQLWLAQADTKKS